MSTYADRLREAAAYNKLPYSQTDIAKFLGIAKQTVDRWFRGGEPKPGMVFHVADRLRVDPRWLATGQGSMFPRHDGVENMTPQESELLERYRRADPQWKRSISTLIKRAAVLLVMTIPPLLPSKAEAAFNINFAKHTAKLHIAFLWLVVRRIIVNLRQFSRLPDAIT